MHRPESAWLHRGGDPGQAAEKPGLPFGDRASRSGKPRAGRVEAAVVTRPAVTRHAHRFPIRRASLSGTCPGPPSPLALAFGEGLQNLRSVQAPRAARGELGPGKGRRDAIKAALRARVTLGTRGCVGAAGRSSTAPLKGGLPHPLACLDQGGVAFGRPPWSPHSAGRASEAKARHDELEAATNCPVFAMSRPVERTNRLVSAMNRPDRRHELAGA